MLLICLCDLIHDWQCFHTPWTAWIAEIQNCTFLFLEYGKRFLHIGLHKLIFGILEILIAAHICTFINAAGTAFI